MSSILVGKSVLVVGGCGFLGYHIVNHLLQVQARVSVLECKLDHNRIDSVDYISGDISNKKHVERILARVRPEVIIHTASPTALASNSDLYFRVNVDGTRNLLEYARNIKTVQAFVYTSSASIVHDTVSDLVMADETARVLYQPEQPEVYGHTKALADDLVRVSNDPDAGFLTVCLRPAGMFGERDVNTLQKMVENAEAGRNKFQVGSGQNRFDFTYVGNAASAHILASEALLNEATFPSQTAAALGVAGEAFFITNDNPMPFWDFVRAIGSAAGRSVQPQDVWIIPESVGLSMALIAEWIIWIWLFGKSRSTMTRSGIRYSCLTRTYCIDKAKTRLGYKPSVSMEDGIKRGVDWWLSCKSKKTQ